MTHTQYLRIANELTYLGRNLFYFYQDTNQGEEYLFIVALLLSDSDLSDLDRDIIRIHLKSRGE